MKINNNYICYYLIRLVDFNIKCEHPFSPLLLKVTTFWLFLKKTRGNLKTTISANWTVFTGSKSPREMTHSSAFRKVALLLLCKNTRNKANTSVRQLSGFHQERYPSWVTRITQRWSAVLNQQWLCSRLLTLYWVILTRKQVYTYLWTTLYNAWMISFLFMFVTQNS